MNRRGTALGRTAVRYSAAMVKPTAEVLATDGARVSEGITRGRRRVRRRSSRSPALTQFLSFLWPGLGQAYVHSPVRALIFAVPPAALVVGLLFLIVASPSGFALNLLAPTFATVIIGLIVVHGLWRIASIVDAWRMTRDRARTLTDRTLPLAALLILITLAAHLTAGVYVQSFAEAGSRIFTGAQPAGPDQIDTILGGDPSPSPDGGALGGVDDLNGDGVIDGDDIDAADINGDGVVDVSDVQDPGLADGDANGDGTVDGNDLPAPGTTPGPSFDPGLTPPPVDVGSGDWPAGSLPSDGPINVLFVGLDSGLGRGHSLSDSLIVGSYYPDRDQMTMISFPRDLGRFPLYTGGSYPNRINTFLGYAGRHPEIFPEGPIAALMKEIGYLLGTRIHFYAATNLEGLPTAVDAVGGVNVVLEKAIADAHWGLYLEPGAYHFNGQTVMPYVRSRYGPNNDDWKRARRQQQVILALADRVKDPAVAMRLPEVISALSEVIRTDVPRDQVRQILSLLERANEASTEQIVLSTPHGYAQRIPAAEVNGRYMIEPNIAAIRELSRRVFGPYSRF